MTATSISRGSVQPLIALNTAYVLRRVGVVASLLATAQWIDCDSLLGIYPHVVRALLSNLVTSLVFAAGFVAAWQSMAALARVCVTRTRLDAALSRMLLQILNTQPSQAISVLFLAMNVSNFPVSVVLAVCQTTLPTLRQRGIATAIYLSYLALIELIWVRLRCSDQLQMSVIWHCLAGNYVVAWCEQGAVAASSQTPLCVRS